MIKVRPSLSFYYRCCREYKAFASYLCWHCEYYPTGEMRPFPINLLTRNDLYRICSQSAWSISSFLELNPEMAPELECARMSFQCANDGDIEFVIYETFEMPLNKAIRPL